MKATKSAITKISILLAIAALLIGAMTISVSAEEISVSFEVKSWNASTETVSTTTQTKTATVLTADMTTLGEAGTETWYVVSNNISLDTNTSIGIEGTVHLILDANLTLTGDTFYKGAINVSDNDTLHIHKKVNGGTATLAANLIGSTVSGITTPGNIYIHGGTVNVTRGIGWIHSVPFGEIVIYDGTVTAQSIGTGHSSSSASTISGSRIGIYGGNVTATYPGTDGPAIGVHQGVTIDSIEIYNATVKAQIGLDGGTAVGNTSAAIGAGSNSEVKNITIKNAKITSTSASEDSGSRVRSTGPAIGGGEGSKIGTVTVTNSNLTLNTGTVGSGIGFCKIGTSSCDEVKISGSTVTVKSSQHTASALTTGIGASNITIDTSTVTVALWAQGSGENYTGIGIEVLESLTLNQGVLDLSNTDYGIDIGDGGKAVINSGTVNLSNTDIGFRVGTDGKVIINGGNVKKSSTAEFEGITNAVNNSGTTLYYVDVTLNNHDGTTVAAGTEITSVVTYDGSSYGAGTNTKILDGGKLYMYLPAATNIKTIKTSSTSYGGTLSGTTTKTGTYYAVCNCSTFSEGVCTVCGTPEPPEIKDGYYLVYDATDLSYIEGLVEGTLKNGSGVKEDVKVKMMNDITSNVTIGTESCPFKGIFDGNGYTLTANTSTFPAVNGATIKNLIYAGSRSFSFNSGNLDSNGNISGNYGGLITKAMGNPVTIENCINTSSYTLKYTTGTGTGAYTANFGMFVAYSDANIIIKNCAFTGKMTLERIDGVSFMVGRCASDATVTISDSYVYFSLYWSYSGDNYYFSNTNNNSTVDNCYYGYYKPNLTATYGSMSLDRNGATYVTDTELSSGEITYRLNNGNADGAWKQTLDGDTPDTLPNFKGKNVEYNYSTQSYDNHDHSTVTYTLTTVNSANDTITIKCDGCAPDGLNVTLTAPANAVYTPADTKQYKKASVTVVSADNIVYKENGSVMSDFPYQAGTYTAEVTVGGKTASIKYYIAKYSGVPAIKATNEVTDTMSPDDVQLAIDNIAEKSNEYLAWYNAKQYGEGYTIVLTDEALYPDKSEYTFKITPSDTRNIETVTGTVEIDVKDTQKPSVSLAIGTQNITLDAQSDGTFKYFFKTSKKITVTATDEEHGSGIAKVYYLISEDYDTDLSSASFAELQGNEIDIPANSKSFVFVKAVDNDGNETVVYTAGTVTYTDSAKDTSSIEYTRTATDDITAKITLNDNTVSKIMNGNEELSAEAYSVATDGTVTFFAEKLSELFLAGEYTFTVYYAPRGVEFAEGGINEAPATTEIKLIVKKAEGKVSNISNISKQYDASEVSAPTYDTLSGGKANVEYRSDEEGSEYSATAPKDVGSYTVRITVAADDDYTEAFATAEFRITKAHLKVTANAHTITYGDAPSNNDVSYDGFEGGDAYTVLGGTLEYEYTYEQFGGVGKYVITPKGYTSNNYDITFETGILTVDKKTASFTTEDQKLMSGEIFDNTKFTHTGLLDGHTATISASGNEIAVDKILDANGEEVTENYNITYASKGEYHFYDANFTSDGTYHWHACKIAGCTDTTEKIECAGGTTTCSTRATCDECGSEYGSTNSFIHSFTNYVSDGNATAETDGTKTAVCDYGCGETESVTDKGSRLEIAVGGFDSDSVKSDDKESLEELVSDIDELLADENITEEQKTALESAKADAEALIGEIEENEKALEEAKHDIASYDIEQINSNDKAELESIVSDIDQLLEGDNLTEEEKGELESVKADAEALIGEIEAVAEAKTNIESTVDSYGVDNVSSDDKTDLESVIENIDRLLASGNYTEEEKVELESEKADVEALIEVIEKNAEAKADVEEKIASYEGGNVNSDDLAGLEAILDTANELLEGDKLTEGERAEVESTKSEAEALISEIEGRVEAKEEVEVKLSDYDSESVKSDDKDSLVAIIDTVTTLLEDGSYTETEKAELEGVRAGAMALIGEIDKNAEAFNAVSGMLSGYDIETVTSDDAESINTIVDTIDTLLSDGNYTEAEKVALEDAKAEAMALIDKIENADEDQTDIEDEEQTGSDLSEKDNGNSATTTVVVVVIVIVILLGGGACLWIFVIKRRR